MQNTYIDFIGNDWFTDVTKVNKPIKVLWNIASRFYDIQNLLYINSSITREVIYEMFKGD